VDRPAPPPDKIATIQPADSARRPYSQRVKKRPGRRPGLTIDLITDAVLQDGIATFSMPSVGERLGVAHSGLYRYVPNREALVVLVLDRIAREATWPSPDQHWRDQLIGIGETFWTICETHPGYDTAALGTDHVSPGFVEAMTPHVHSMHAQGLDLVEATAAIEFIANMTLNCSIAAARLRKVQQRPDVPEHSIDGFHDPDMWSGRGWYQRHLDVHLAGLEARLGAQHG
jgi:AcrR family transcriptional regulator